MKFFSNLFILKNINKKSWCLIELKYKKKVKNKQQRQCAFTTFKLINIY